MSIVAARHVLVAAGLIACLASPVAAHHSYTIFYDLCSSVSIDGRIERVQWKNPHVLIDLRRDDGTGYVSEWGDVQTLIRLGVKADVLKAGDRVVITGSPQRPLETIDPAYRHLVDPTLKVVSALTHVHRASDGWDWKREVTTPPECAGR